MSSRPFTRWLARMMHHRSGYLLAQRQNQELLTFNDHMLRDVGLTRREVRGASRMGLNAMSLLDLR